jgi:regulatory protein
LRLCLWILKRGILNPVRLWHKNGALSQSRSSRPARPLDTPTLQALALRYVGRFATTEAKLALYLKRKISERGWTEDEPPPVAAIVSRFVGAGYVNDTEFANARARSLARRGYGHRRLEQSLTAAGVSRAITQTLVPQRDEAFAAAEAFARRRRLGPFCDTAVTPADRRRHFAALVRAGHEFEFAKFFSSPKDGDTITEQPDEFDR